MEQYWWSVISNNTWIKREPVHLWLVPWGQKKNWQRGSIPFGSNWVPPSKKSSTTADRKWPTQRCRQIMSKSLNGSSNPSSFFIFLLAYPSKFWTQRSLYSPGILLVIPSFHCIAVLIIHCSLDKTGHPYSLSARPFPESGHWLV